jgi:hypothetical protein
MKKYIKIVIFTICALHAQPAHCSLIDFLGFLGIRNWSIVSLIFGKQRYWVNDNQEKWDSKLFDAMMTTIDSRKADTYNLGNEERENLSKFQTALKKEFTENSDHQSLRQALYAVYNGCPDGGPLRKVLDNPANTGLYLEPSAKYIPNEHIPIASPHFTQWELENSPVIYNILGMPTENYDFSNDKAKATKAQAEKQRKEAKEDMSDERRKDNLRLTQDQRNEAALACNQSYREQKEKERILSLPNSNDYENARLENSKKRLFSRIDPQVDEGTFWDKESIYRDQAMHFFLKRQEKYLEVSDILHNNLMTKSLSDTDRQSKNSEMKIHADVLNDHRPYFNKTMKEITKGPQKYPEKSTEREDAQALENILGPDYENKKTQNLKCTQTIKSGTEPKIDPKNLATHTQLSEKYKEKELSIPDKGEQMIHCDEWIIANHSLEKENHSKEEVDMASKIQQTLILAAMKRKSERNANLTEKPKPVLDQDYEKPIYTSWSDLPSTDDYEAYWTSDHKKYPTFSSHLAAQTIGEKCAKLMKPRE